MAKLGDVYIHAEKETWSDTVKATEYAVERGEPFTDHVERLPLEFSVTANIVGPDSGARLQKLRQYQAKGTIVKYVGRASVENVIILDIKRDYDSKVANGTIASISLRKIRIATSPWVKNEPKQSGKKKPVQKKEPQTTARYHVTKAGDTYSGLSRQYGSSIQQLRDWNQYPDRRIPIGVKLRVK